MSISIKVYRKLLQVPKGKVTTYGDFKSVITAVVNGNADATLIDEIAELGYLGIDKEKVKLDGDLAKAVGLKNGQRFIGTIMKKNPYPAIIPCHRVVKSDGKIGGYSYGEKVKLKMLEKEGIKIKDGKIIDFDKEKFYF